MNKELKEFLPEIENESFNIKEILNKFEISVFCGTKKAFNVFKSFDKDNDGFYFKNF